MSKPNPERPIYWSTVPLFSLRASSRPLQDGTYRCAEDETELSFSWSENHYLMTGAEPGTVSIIAVSGRGNAFLFQQSNGPGIAFYGALRRISGRAGFDLFSPESRKDDAAAAALAHGAAATQLGYRFTSSGAVSETLLSLAFDSSDDCWNSYLPV
ncbi:MAG: hypothetical protein CMN73_00605 [Sphingomonas sp.]|nr:hypothetical protein [Sphingomonas sp.]